MVEILDKGYGFGPGILAFIAASSATNFASGFLGLTTVMNNKGKWESNGALVNFVRGFFSKNLVANIYNAFTRENLTNLTQIYVALFTVGVLTYLSNFRSEIPIKSLKVRSMVSVYPIKLFYCGALPIIFSYAILYNLNIVAFSLTKILPEVDFLKYIAVYKLDTLNGHYDLDSGLLYFLSPSTKTWPSNSRNKKSLWSVTETPTLPKN
ncbi:unnamed protein product [Ambrosiozyma monospora]|uniref:Unnamed protein product n=1 Tax=Ambrosiozyma monospora TaxID=43982 RepID=A0ACB5TCN4_AMBMO|nr:unnamed protein product [Ambrosiozyma monospora]